MVMEYMEIGSSPYEEDCAQVGSNGYVERANKELFAYMNQLKRLFPAAESLNVRFRIKWFSHDFGSYGEVCMHWDTGNEEADVYVYEIEKELPGYWDEEAKKELGETNE